MYIVRIGWGFLYGRMTRKELYNGMAILFSLPCNLVHRKHGRISNHALFQLPPLISFKGLHFGSLRVRFVPQVKAIKN